MNIKNKLLLPLLGLFALIYIMSVGYVIQRMYFRNINDAQKIVEANAYKQANLVKTTLIKDISVFKTLASTFETYKKLPLSIREEYQLDILKNVLKENNNLLAAFLNRQLFSVTPEKWNKEYGRVKQLYYKKNNEILFDTEVVEKEGEIVGSLYNVIHTENKEYITEPYFDEYKEGEKKLMTSICIPVRENGQFIGLTGGDISLDRMKTLIGEFDDNFNQKNYLISNKGTYIYSDNKLDINKSFKSINPKIDSLQNFSQKVLKGQAFSYYITDSVSNNEYLCTVKPIEFGGDFKPWAMLVIVPKEKITSEAKSIFRTSIIVGLLAFVILFIAIYLIANSFTKPVLEIVEFTKEIASGNLNAKLNIKKRSDEFGMLASYLNQMVLKFKSVIVKIQKTSEDINVSGNFLKEKSIEISEGTSMQATSAQEVSASMEEMMSLVEQNTLNANETSNIAKKTVTLIKQSENDVNKTATLMANVVGRTSDLDDISFQVNILALNSAIEASHAGQYGKGFSVVAKEVRKLAKKSKQITKSISSVLNETLEISEKSVVSLKDVVPEMASTAKLVDDISISGYEQNNGVKQVNNAMNTLNEVIQKNSHNAEQMLENSKDLDDLAEDFKELISFFRT